MSIRTNHKPIQVTDTTEIEMVPPSRPRSLWSQFWTLVLQPVRFFRALPLALDTRQWFWIALLVLALTGLSAVRGGASQDSAAGTDGSNAPPVEVGGGPGVVVEGGGAVSGGGGIAIDPGIPPDAGAPSSGAVGGKDPAKVSADWTTALIAASNVVLAWLMLAVILCEVPLLNGVAPRFGQNMQVAIWASVPLGLMAALQLVYYAAGGKAGEPGLAGLLPEWSRYGELSDEQRSILLSLASRLTLFGLWTAALVYTGARHALHGRRLAVLLAVLAWVVLVVVLPVVTGSVKAPESTDAGAVLIDPAQQGGEMPGVEGEMPPGAELPVPSEEALPGGETPNVTGGGAADQSPAIEATAEPESGESAPAPDIQSEPVKQ